MTAPIAHACTGEADADAIRRLMSDLQRYAGWLAKDRASVAVRVDVQALGAAMDTGNETLLWLVTLDKDIGRLPSGDLRTMLRKTLGKIRTALEATEST